MPLPPVTRYTTLPHLPAPYLLFLPLLAMSKSESEVLDVQLTDALRELDVIKKQYNSNASGPSLHSPAAAHTPLQGAAAAGAHAGGNINNPQSLDAAPPRASDDRPLSPSGRSLGEKLRIAETVMRKLYQRNIELEKQVGATGGTNGSLNSGNGGHDRSLGVGPSSSSSEDAQELVVLRRRLLEFEGMDPQRMRQESRMLQHSLAAAQGDLQRSLDELALLKRDFSKLCSKRLRRIMSFEDGDRASQEMLRMLNDRLKQQDRERSAEQDVFRDKLTRAEQQQCDWYVERRLLEQQVAHLTIDVSNRDELESSIQQCVADITMQLAALKTENAELKANQAASSNT